ncbi:calcium/sodium antiporter [Billgrantia lactosivorans]|uniref:calcium/sodium antiporter n=1 Tax=Billgrantia lactosivorans TaxID=2185141 RepID=UPI000DAD90C1|nr:calcium/sodium antiporter [Halomonas lactosivorans]
MLLPIVTVTLGLAVLTWSADRFVNAAAATASRSGMSAMLVGMTVVALGTSAPEMVVALFAALEGLPDLATGNALGSNIANIGLVLGATAVVRPIPVPFSLVRRELPLLLGATGITGYALANGFLGPFDALVLLLLMVFSLWWLVRADTPDAAQASDIPDMTLRRALCWLAATLLLLSLSSRVLVWGASELARGFGISELVIGLTVVAVGTSLPELAACVASAVKRHHDLAIGNVIGSNLFNLLAVLPIPALIAPGAPHPDAAGRDYRVMLLLTLALALLLMWQRQGRLGRTVGAAFLVVYAAYLAWLGVSGSAT